MARWTRAGQPYNPPLVGVFADKTKRDEVFVPTRGLHQGDTALDLAPGYTPSAYNFVVSEGHIMPRSGMSRFFGGTSQLSGAAQGAWRANDHQGAQYLVAASDRTVVVFDPIDADWSALSYVQPSSWSTSYMPSGSSRHAYDATWVFDESLNANIVVLTNNVDMPFETTLKTSMTTYSTHTGFSSFASRARSVAVADDRLVWWGCGNSTQSFPTRIVFSARGLPRNYQIADGAGAEDLLDMGGVATKVVAEREGLLLFSDREIWRGRLRRDLYVFDFYPIEKQFGAPYARTVCLTPVGTIFLGGDLELYLVRGDDVQALGPAQPGEQSRIQSWFTNEIFDPERAWSTYNALTRRYELYYPSIDSADGYPRRALYFNIDDLSFMPQRFGKDLSAGVDFASTGVGYLWDDMVQEWHELTAPWDDLFEPGSGEGAILFDDDGIAYMTRANAYDDDGTTIDTMWQSHAMDGADLTERIHLTDVWLDYKANVASALTVTCSSSYDFMTSHSMNVPLQVSSLARAHTPMNAQGHYAFVKLQGVGGSYKIARMQTRLVAGGIF